jgi:hypothetical protein
VPAITLENQDQGQFMTNRARTETAAPALDVDNDELWRAAIHAETTAVREYARSEAEEASNRPGQVVEDRKVIVYGTIFRA